VGDNKNMDNKQFSLYYELHDKLGEDAEPLIEDMLIGVFDGMAGAGCIKFEDKDGMQITNAYKASRLVRDCVQTFYKDCKEDICSVFDDQGKLDAVIKSLVEKLLCDLGCYADENKLTSMVKIRSTLIKLLPTTMAVAVVRDNGNSIDVLCLWAGDSRCYIMSPQDGLQQLTKDDLKMPNDAMQNTISDSPMSNYVHLPLSGDHKTPQFKINGKVYKNIHKPYIVFVATDGCFGYVKSPMSFEYLILKSLEKTHNSGMGLSSLGSIIKEALIDLPTSDDCSLAGMVFAGDLSECEFFKLYIQRQSKIRNEYIEKIGEEKIDELSQGVKTYQNEKQVYMKDKIEKLITKSSNIVITCTTLQKPLPKIYGQINCINKLREDLQKRFNRRSTLNDKRKCQSLNSEEQHEVEELNAQLTKENITQTVKSYKDEIILSLMKTVENNNGDIQYDGCQDVITLVKTVSDHIKSIDSKIKKLEDELNCLKCKILSVETAWSSYKSGYEAYSRRKN